MKHALTSFTSSLQILFKDKVNLALTLLPITIGILLYYFLGTTVYDYGMTHGKELVDNYVENSAVNTFLSYTIQIILYIALFFIVNWTFVLIISVIASPFNDVMSSRIEKIVNGEALPSLGTSFNSAFKNFFSTILNEMKKILFILFLTIISLLLSLIPLLTPISLFLTVVLVAIAYLDYSWSRHNIPFRLCINDITKNVVGYGLGGAFFFFMISIPVLNLIVPPWATSFFTTVWVKNHGHRPQIT